MNNLNILHINSGMLLITFFFCSCSREININTYINKTIPLRMVISTRNDSTGFTSVNRAQIEIYSDKWKKLIEWGNENTDDWQPTTASFISDIYIVQGNFRLLYFIRNHDVVIGFTDKDGKPRQYSKSILKGSLDFLNK